MNLREVTLVIPEERLGELYALAGQWLQGTAAQEEAVPPARERARPTSRYDAIATLLDHQGDEVAVTFARVEEAIGGALPASARKHRPWWANTTRNTQARAWLGAGYTVTGIDFEDERVTFTRSA